MPDSPDFRSVLPPGDNATSHRTTHRVTRRRVLRFGWIGAGIALLGTQIWLLLKLLLQGSTGSEPRRDIAVGAVDDYGMGSVTHFWKEHFLLVRTPQGYVALSHDCTHGQCRVDFVPERGILACPCHGSHFSVTGAVLSGPATRPLDRYAVSEHAGQVVVHTAQRRRMSPAS